ncbi:hypothetical protein [Deinococcus ruber]|uniref:Uncharacterized protein n=1 Tax=Deinococcus ruber TaxID=1848197 RepID=A0A918C8N8_9DEIO|nr:hypothetical protein [Deinococcus ruber]GGR11213.1 hypothetical protein GCM10008957_24880 [Deinococcus ruber]
MPSGDDQTSLWQQLKRMEDGRSFKEESERETYNAINSSVDLNLLINSLLGLLPLALIPNKGLEYPALKGIQLISWSLYVKLQQANPHDSLGAEERLGLLSSAEVNDPRGAG